jgi:hypothetical protein
MSIVIKILGFIFILFAIFVLLFICYEIFKGLFGFLRKCNKWILVAVFGLLMMSLLFYWFEWRPSQIIKNCNNSAIKQSQRSYEDNYQKCLRKNGL